MTIRCIEDLPVVIGFKEICAVTGMTKPTIFRMIEEGKFDRWLDTGHKNYKFARRCLRDYLPEKAAMSEDELREFIHQEIAAELAPVWDTFRSLARMVPNG